MRPNADFINYPEVQPVMKQTTSPPHLVWITALILSGCSHNQTHEAKASEQAITFSQSVQHPNKCKDINENIADSRLFSTKMAKNCFAIYYQAISRDKIAKLQMQSKDIGCV